MVPVPSTIQIGAYLHGLINPRDHTNPGISGLVAIDYNVFFSTDQYFDRNGNKVIGIDLPNNLGSIPLEVYLSEYQNHQAISLIVFDKWIQQ
jgi:hypothetical protein